MSITRTRLEFEKHYVQIPNAWMRDRRLSRRARGLLAELMTHEVGWNVTTESLAAGGPEGRDAIRSAVKELEEFGYLTRSRKRTEGNRLAGTDYVLSDPHESPTTGNPSLEIREPEPEIPTPGNPTPGNPPLRTPSPEHHSQKGGEDTVPSPAPALSNEREDPWTDLVGGSSKLPSVAKGRPDRCEYHAHMTGGVGPCAGCKTAREKHEEAQREIQREAQREYERQQAAAVAERQARIEECELCDAFGYLEGRPCHHDPELQERNRRGAELVRKSLGKK